MAIVLTSACIGQASSNPYQLDFGGAKITFRSNLQVAAQVPVDDASHLRKLLLDPNLETVHLAYVPNQSAAPLGGTITGFYLADGYELGYKLTAVYSTYFGAPVPLNSLPLNSTDEALAAATKYTPVILMQAGTGPTGVVVDHENYIVYVRGADLTEVDRDYTDLDLAVDRLLLVLMGRE